MNGRAGMSSDHKQNYNIDHKLIYGFHHKLNI